MTDVKQEIDSTIRQMLGATDRQTWYRYRDKFRVRIVQAGRIEVESDIPGYDHGSPICVPPDDLQDLGDFLTMLGKVLEKKNGDVAKKP